MTSLLLQFSYLQVLDFLSTAAFLAYGIHEGNPLVRFLMNQSPHPLVGLFAVKLLAMLLGLFAWWMGKHRALLRANILFACIVAWNLLALIMASIKV